MKKILFKLFAILLFVFIQGGAAFADFSFKEMELSFVQISDTHISDRENNAYKALGSSKELLKDAIEQVNNMKNIDFVMFTGDMVDEPLKTSYRDFFIELSKLGYPAFMTFGNHDFSQLPEGRSDAPNYISKDEALDIIKKCNPFYIFEESYYAFSPKEEYRVIVLDTVIDSQITSNGELTTEQAEFLKKELEENKDKVILIFHHHPVAQPFKSEHHKILNDKEYMEIIKQYKKTPIAIFSGHYHAAKIQKQGNILHISTPSTVSYPNAFRYVNITNFDDRTIFDIKYFETGLKEVQKGAKMNAIAAATLKGTPKDHNQVITIRKDRNNNNEPEVEKQKIPKEDRARLKEMKKAEKAQRKQQRAAERAQKKINKIKDMEDVQKSLQENADEMSDDIELLRQN